MKHQIGFKIARQHLRWMYKISKHLFFSLTARFPKYGHICSIFLVYAGFHTGFFVRGEGKHLGDSLNVSTFIY